ncbi:hypothetical protein ASD86_18050 [Lysobacter sp. Root690]|nr:hypothetical protein ASD86_18050 [Lysobacter sp. Root690]
MDIPKIERTRSQGRPLRRTRMFRAAPAAAASVAADSIAAASILAARLRHRLMDGGDAAPGVARHD